MVDVRGLACDIDTPDGTVSVLRDVDLRIGAGRAFGIVGESGSGKSMLLRSVLGLVPATATVRGSTALAGQDLGRLTQRQLRTHLGRTVGMVFQNPMTSLNPVVRIGRQISEASRYHHGTSRKQARARAVELLDSVGIPNARQRFYDYPHQLSGGMRQRVMIATALACEPEVLVADEATTALDVTVQREILDLLGRVQRERNMTLVLVSHDLSIVAGRTDDVAVMYAGRIVEQAPTAALFRDYRHRYTEALMEAVPRLDQPPHTRLRTIPGQPPSLLNPPDGCPFASRCHSAVRGCHEALPPVTTGSYENHSYRCFVPVSSDARRAPGPGEEGSLS